MKGFDHPNIIQLYEIYEYGNYFYVVTEFCQGGSVVNFIQNHIHRLNENLARQVIKQILEALVYLHDLQIIHRDIKLENIVFVEDDG
jgi:calcium-dependent protein kinase